jgi:ketosteroid isomerase-like protein
VQRLEDQDAIWRLFMTYKTHLDQRDFKAYASLFTNDAEWMGNLGKCKGPKQIEQMLKKTLAVFESDRDRQHHLVLNPVIDVDGDTATASSTWGFVTRSESDAPVLSMLGTYYDELRRTDDGWKFSQRVAYSDIPYIDITEVKTSRAPYVDPQYVLG